MALDNKELLAARVTAFENALKVLEGDVTAQPPDIVALEAQLQVTRTKYMLLDETHEKVIEQLINEGKKDDYILEEDKRGLIYRQLQIAEAKAEKILRTLKPPPSVDTSIVDPPPPKTDSHRIALPQKKLPEFGGDVREWLGFWAAYQQIDSDAGLTEAEKFQYLLQCVTVNSPARKLIDSFPVSAKNYQAAVDTLKAHYGRKNMLVRVYVRDLLQLVIKNAVNKGKVELMELVPKLSSQIRNLEELGVTSDKCEDILYPVVESCLPDDVLQAWQRNVNYEEKLDPIMAFLSNEVTNKLDRTLAQMDFSVSSSPAPIEDKRGKGRNNNKGSSADIPTAAAMMNAGQAQEKGKNKIKCEFCEKSHESHTCGKAKTTMSLEERKAIIKEKKLCFQCLRPGHVSQKCRKFVICSVCSGKHYEMLCHQIKRSEPIPGQPTHNMMTTRNPGNHSQQQFMDGMKYQSQQHDGYLYTQQHPQQSSQPSWTPKDSKPEKTGNFSNVTAPKKKVLLYTFMAVIETPVGEFQVRVFLDDGSDESYILSEVAENCNLKAVGSQVLAHQLFGGNTTKPIRHSQYEVTLRNLNGNGRGTFIFNSSEAIAKKIRKPPPGDWMKEMQRKGVIINDQSDAPDEVHLLIGMNIACQIWTGRSARISPTMWAQETSLGWVVGGTHLSKNQDDDEDDTTTTSSMVTTMLASTMSPEDLWSLEILGITDEPTSQTKADLELAALQHFKNTVTRKADGRYQVSLPWINGHEKLKNNYSQAVSRLHQLTKDLKQDGYLQAYHDIIMGWKEDGIVEEIPDQSATNVGFYMPHRHVVKESSSTTPLRPVFNASAKAKGSISLNECLESGPNLLELIPGILLRFRRYEFATISDVKRAFLQISVLEEHRDFLRFAWWQDSTCKTMKSFRHCRVVFGVKSSPFLLAATLRHHVEQEPGVEPEMKKKLLQSLYVDNSVVSHSSFEEAVRFKEDSQDLLLPAKFDLRGWEFGPSEEEKVVPVLGMIWNTKSDRLSLSLESTLEKLNGPSTKRGLLSMLSSVFDPMGHVCPFTLIPKILYQKCCLQELKWDEQLPVDMANVMEKWKLQVPVLQKFQIPRWMSNTNKNEGLSIHSFCDGSSYAYATSIYLRSEVTGKVEVQLMAAKSRVAPSKKKCTIPRLELLACLIGIRLTKEVITALEFQNIPVYFWSDSTTALAWIKNSKEWGRFVANRVDEIRKFSQPNQWNHVPGEINPADLPSRGCSASKLLELRWWEGPDWLKKPQESWPKSSATPNPEDVSVELKKTVVSALAVSKEWDICEILLRRSDYHKALRTVAHVNRYIDRLKLRVEERKTGAGIVKNLKKSTSIFLPTAEDISRAEYGIISIIQRSSFSGLDDPRLKDLCVFKDEKGIIRIKSQLYFGNDEFSTRCPAVLPHDNEMVQLIIRKVHEMNSHAGVQTLQAILRDNFWILKSRRTISKIVRSCAKCRRFLAKKCEVPSPQLPLDRIKDTVSFDITGVDLAGPLFLRGGEKVWIVLYTDAVYRGVHLELTRTLSAEGFMMTLRRFVDRRGRPSVIYSDNGLNFVGTNNLFRSIDWNEVSKYAAVQRIKWKFNPPTAAWWGGWWERLVGLMKTLLRRILGNKVVNYDQLQTILCDVEATMNRRPLTFVSESNGDLIPLRPSFFMKDNPAEGLPEADAVDSKSLRKGAKICQGLRDIMRSRFRKEYLGQLQHQATTRCITVKPGDVVLIGDDFQKRIDWPLGVVRETYLGKDKKVHMALVETKDGSYLRAVQRLYILEVSEDKEETPSSSSSEKPVVEQRTRSGRRVVQPDRLGLK